jgi:protein tyrosine phosphatase (PTP) superfamily phosphohydrolase (DUF442 family)
LTTSGQPNEAQLAALKGAGVRIVINLAPHDHPKALTDEIGCCARLGLEYIHIPVAFDRPQESDFQKFCEAMEASKGETVHIHCIVNARVTAFLYRYDVSRNGITHGVAQAQMNRIWKPGNVWAEFIDDSERISAEHEYAGRDYAPL